MKTIPDIVTISRIAASAAMMFFAPNTSMFWILYVWCGFSDIADGAIARRLGTQSATGARLDSIADLAFVVICLVKLLPVFPLPSWLIAWMALIALHKMAGYAFGLASQKRFVALHTPANKAAGVLIFLSVPAVLFTGSAALAIPACTLATFAAIQESRCIRLKRIAN